MSALKQIFKNVWFAASHLSKKAYTTGLIVFSGAVAVAVMFIGVNGFTGSSNINHHQSYEVEEEDNSDVVEVEQVVGEVTSEESSTYYVEWAMANYEATVIEASQGTVTTLAKEEGTEKVLRTSAEEEESSDQLSVKDYTALLRIVEAEATDEDLKGKVLIANVVMNRVASGRFPDTIYEVVHQKLGGRAQFSPIDDGRYYSVPITNSTEQAVAKALEGSNYSNGALFFVAKSLASESAGSWFDNNLEFIMTHGVHSFYRYQKLIDLFEEGLMVGSFFIGQESDTSLNQ